MCRITVIPQKADIRFQNGGKLNLRAAVSIESDTGEDVRGGSCYWQGNGVI